MNDRSSLRLRGAGPLLIVLFLLVFISVAAYAPAQGKDLEDAPAAAPSPSLLTLENNFTPWSEAKSAQPDGVERLVADSGGTAQISTHPATGMARFVRLEAGSLDLGLAEGAAAEALAAAFFNQYGDVFGIADANTELKYLGVRQDIGGRSHLSYQQVYQGVPVFGGVVRVHVNTANELTAVNGVFIPDVALNAAPTLAAGEAAAMAVAEVLAQKSAERGASVDLEALQTTLYVYRTNLARGTAGQNHLVYEVEVGNRADAREFVYVDAHSGKIVDQMSGIHEDLYRKVYDGGYGPSFLVWEEGDPLPYGNVDIDNIIEFTEDSYDLYSNMTGGTYLSFDGADAIMESVNDDPTIFCPNANWNGLSTNYCTGVTGDDTVAHEWTHAYTQYTHGLVYQWQPGALNEAYSDIFGEVVDDVNGPNLPDALRSTGGCSIYGNGIPSVDNSYRWLSAEDDPAFGGAIRDLWNPTCYGDPGKVTDTQYFCSSQDQGGVHTNSGVPNHAFALTVDGGTYNGQTITGLGWTKAAHVYWQAMYVYQTQTTDFTDHADSLASACTDLIGVDLLDLGTGLPSGEIITAADCTEVDQVALAIELRTYPSQCNYEPILDPETPALCEAGTGSSVTIFEDDFESDPTTTWTLSNEGVYPGYTPRDWEWRDDLPNERPGSAFYALDDVFLGNCSGGPGDESHVMHADSQVITIPDDATVPRLAFTHYVASELSWDGGNLKVSVNGGPWQLVADGAFTFNDYNLTLTTSGGGNTNPLAGEAAFSGSDAPSADSNWGTSLVNLAGYVQPGDTVQLRLDFGVDGCNGLDGWYVDDLQMYHCTDETGGPGAGAICSQPNLPIPDFDTSGVTNTLTITNTGSLLDMNVYVDVTHTLVGDLTFDLMHVDTGTIVRVIDRPGVPAATFGCIGDDILATLDDEAATPVEDECGDNVPTIDGSFIPNESLTAFDGLELSGDWTLRARDVAGGDTGTLAEWCIIPEVPEADIVVEPSSVSSAQPPDTVVTHTLTISNEGNIDLTWSIVEETAPGGGCSAGDLPWLTVAPTDGTTAPDDAAAVNVTFDATGLAAGDHTGSLCVSSNDPDTPIVDVPITLTVQQANIVVEPSSVTSTQLPNTVVTHTLTINNEGAIDLTWAIVEEEASLAASGSCSAGDLPWLTVEPTSGTTAPGDAATVDVTFDATGLAAGTYTGSLCISSNDPDTSIVDVPVTLTVEQDTWMLYLPAVYNSED